MVISLTTKTLKQPDMLKIIVVERERQNEKGKKRSLIGLTSNL